MEIVSQKAQLTREGLHQLRRIAELLDIQLDEDKTVLWSNDEHERKSLRDEEFKVAMWTRDLGGHVQFSKQMTNSVITKKIAAFKPRWADIARSHAPYGHKLKAIKMVAWPNTLHGITSVHLGDDHYNHMRTGALRGLGEHMWGASPTIHLSLIEHPSADPGFYAVYKTVVDIRAMLAQEACIPVLEKLAEPNLRSRPPVGPCSVLLSRLQSIQWHWEHGTFWDHWGFPVNIWQCSIQELRQKITNAWQSNIMHKVDHRATFQGIHQTSPYLTTASMPPNPIDASVLRKCLNGTFFTADHQKYREDEGNTDCPFCHSPDNQFHRHWECPELEDARKNMPEEYKKFALASPPATYNHGWIPNPDALPYFQKAIQNIPCHTNDVNFPPIIPNFLDIFTDGACLGPACKLSRLASWACVLHTPDMSQEFTTVGASVLPGLIQTITRAELTATIAALQLAERTQRPFRLWIDNDFVVSTLREAFETPEIFISKISHKNANHDLLETLNIWIHRTRYLCRGIVKVYSHQDGNQPQDPVTEFAIAGNNAADKAAAQAYMQFPHLLKLWTVVSKQTAFLASFRDSLHTMFIQIGHLALRKISNQSRGISAARGQVESHRDLQMCTWKVSHLSPPQKPYLTDDWTKISQWVDSLHDANQPVQLWSWYQLYVDLITTFPGTTPWYKKSVKEWQNGNSCPPVPFRKKCRWVMGFFTRTWKHLGVELPLRLCRPSSDVLLFWCPCITVQTSTDRTERLDQFFASWRTSFVEWSDMDVVRM